ncbi:MAG TPA: hypothetical protein VMS12_04125 [Thermoanaerobaculia bacterium]|nr:hypothetical protein [Thermoanaerobaculia bacterium]
MKYAPETAEERLAVLRARLKTWERSGLIDAERARNLAESTRSRWIHSALVSRAIYFVLTLICVAAVYGLASLAGLPEAPVTAILCLVVAEVLILRFGLFRAGPDEALYLAGLFLLIFARPGPPRDEVFLLISGALVLAGVRLRNGFFLTGSVIAAIVYLAVKSDQAEVAALLSLGVAFAGIALLNRNYLHPIRDRFFLWIIVVMPPFAYALLQLDGPGPGMYMIAGAFLIAAMLLLAGIAIRHHAPLLSGLLVAGIGGYETGQRMDIPIEFRLMFAGALIGTVVLILHRMFRDRTTGITSERLLQTEHPALLEPLAAAALAASQPSKERPSGREGGGGRYGGGGASGEF